MKKKLMISMFYLQIWNCLGVVVHTYNPRTWEAEGKGLLGYRVSPCLKIKNSQICTTEIILIFTIA